MTERTWVDIPPKRRKVWPEWDEMYAFPTANSMAGWNWETELDGVSYRLSTGMRPIGGWEVRVQRASYRWNDLFTVPIPGNSRRSMLETIDELKARLPAYLVGSVL